MNSLYLKKIDKIIEASIKITGSKSETNRLLILQQYLPNIQIENASNSNDSTKLKNALVSKSKVRDIRHAGTAMRFLTAYFATLPNKEFILTGSARMQERPIKVLVEALRDLGADISYLEKEGYPPLKIIGSELQKDEVSLRGDISSQYITALLLIGPKLVNGLKINFLSELTSVPYVEMTLDLLRTLGIKFNWVNNSIKVFPVNNITDTTITVESDWSSASYFYSLTAMNPGAKITLSSYLKESLQGDALLQKIYSNLGVKTEFIENTIRLTHNGNINKAALMNLDLRNAPDIAQTIAVTCLGLGIPCLLTGLHTLKIKETDRLQALKNELEKLGGKVNISADSLSMEAATRLKANCSIATYNDHRMALSFAPLSTIVPLQIVDPDVVRKSYPGFWKDFKEITE